jgi:hypothetical protein
MRLSGLVLASLLVVSSALFAQHAGGAGGGSSSAGSSSAGSSHSSYSGASVSSSSHSSSAPSHVSSTTSHASSATGAARTAPGKLAPTTKEGLAPKKSGPSFWHPFRKPVVTAEFRRPEPCFKRPCAVCPPGQSHNGRGACGVVSSVCSSGQHGNGFGCGTQYWLNDCRALANQLAMEQQRMQGQVSPGESVRYRSLLDQYERCASRYGYAFNNALLLDTP